MRPGLIRLATIYLLALGCRTESLPPADGQARAAAAEQPAIDHQPGEAISACTPIAHAALPRARGNVIVLGLYV